MTPSETQTHVNRLIISHTKGQAGRSAIALPAEHWENLRAAIHDRVAAKHGAMLCSHHEDRENFLYMGIPIVLGDAESVEMSGIDS